MGLRGTLGIEEHQRDRSWWPLPCWPVWPAAASA